MSTCIRYVERAGNMIFEQVRHTAQCNHAKPKEGADG